jgi:hypothetical protein
VTSQTPVYDATTNLRDTASRTLPEPETSNQAQIEDPTCTRYAGHPNPTFDGSGLDPLPTPMSSLTTSSECWAKTTQATQSKTSAGR